MSGIFLPMVANVLYMHMFVYRAYLERVHMSDMAPMHYD